MKTNSGDLNCAVGAVYPSPLACDNEKTGRLCVEDPMNFGVGSICGVCNKTN